MAYASLRTTATPEDASRTITITNNTNENTPANNGDSSTSGTLRLRGAPRNGQRVTWDDDVVDNEGCGRKSSKICCIYHKPRKFDESSSEESSDSDSGSDSSGGPIRRRRKCNHDHSKDGDADSAAPGPDHKYEPNAYERMPKSSKGKGKQKSNS